MPGRELAIRSNAKSLASTKDLLEHFLETLAPNTLYGYSSDLRDFSIFRGHFDETKGIQELVSLESGGEANQMVLEYRTNLLARGLSSSTVSRRLASVRSFTKYARMIGAITWMIEVKNPKNEPRYDMRGPNPAEFKAFWKALKGLGSTPEGYRDRAIVSLLYDLALRRAEVVSLDVADIDLAGSSIRVLRKGNRERVRLTMPEVTCKTVREWLTCRGDTPGPLFCRLDDAAWGTGRLRSQAVYTALQRHAWRAGIKAPIRPHGLRHSAITAALNAKVDIRDVRKFSGHQSIQTVLKYDDERGDTAGDVAKKVAGNRT